MRLLLVSVLMMKRLVNNGNDWLERLGSSPGLRWSGCKLLDVTAALQVSKIPASRTTRYHSPDLANGAGSASSERYHQVQDAFAKISRHWLYNATVGAGSYRLTTAYTRCVTCGCEVDDIIALSGIFSSIAILVVPTVRWCTVPFSELVDLAWQQGLLDWNPTHVLIRWFRRNGSRILEGQRIGLRASSLKNVRNHWYPRQRPVGRWLW